MRFLAEDGFSPREEASRVSPQAQRKTYCAPLSSFKPYGRDKEIERIRERETDRERERDRETGRERERETERQRERERERKRERKQKNKIKNKEIKKEREGERLRAPKQHQQGPGRRCCWELFWHSLRPFPSPQVSLLPPRSHSKEENKRTPKRYSIRKLC